MAETEKKDKLDREMDATLAGRVAELHAGDDESGDGRVNSKDMKIQLDRIEAQLELQDRQNRALLKGQRVRLWLSVGIALVLCAAVVFLWQRVNQAYADIRETSAQVNELAGRLQESLAELDNEELAAMMQNLPAISEKLSNVDVDALNEVLTRMPALMDTITEIQDKITGLQDMMDGLREGFGNFGSNIGSGIGGLFGLGGD